MYSIILYKICTIYTAEDGCIILLLLLEDCRDRSYLHSRFVEVTVVVSPNLRIAVIYQEVFLDMSELGDLDPLFY